MGEARDVDVYHFAHGPFRAAVDAQGAELTSFAHDGCGELLWQAGPIWPQHAPVLFPIVGQLAHDTLRIGGKAYPMSRHGFARRRRFTWLAQSHASCALELRDDAETRAQYPFAFRLQLAFALADDGLTISFEIENPGPQTLPVSAGMHPAFRWPLVEGVAKIAHTLRFAAPEPAPIYRLADGLLKRETFPSPIVGRTLALDESLFAADAIVMRDVVSRAVRYEAPGTPVLDVSWTGFRDLGLWSKPGGDFICIEPWYGYASPNDFDGPFDTKPGLLHIASGASEKFTLVINATPAPSD